VIRIALNQLAKGSLIYGIGSALQRFIGLLLLPFFTSVLTPEDYGIVALVSLIGIAMNGLLTLGTGNSMGLLYFKQEDLSKRPTIIWTTVVLMTLNGLLWYSLLWLIAPTFSELMFQTAEYANLILLTFLGSVLVAMTDPWLAFLRMEELAKKYVLITVPGALLTTAISVFLVLYLRWGVVGLLLAGTLGSAIMLGVTWLVVGRNIGYKLDSNLFLPLVRIGFPSIFGLFAFLLIDYADRQMIERMLGLVDLGIYSVGYSFGMVMMVAMTAFSTAWPPFFMSYVNKQDEARKVFAHVLTYYVLGFGSLVVLFFLVARPATLLMTAPNFHDAWVVVGLVAAAYALKGCYLILLPGIYFGSKLKWQSIIEWVAAIMNIGLNILLIPIYGILGAAIATFISYLSLPVLAWLVARSYLKVDYEWARLGAISLFNLSFSLLAYFLSKTFHEFQLLVLGLYVVMGICYLYTAYLFLLKKHERQLLIEFVWR